MKGHKWILAILALGVTATLALGQNADKNSAGPTKNDYRLRVLEPREGSTVTGPTVRVVVSTEIPGQPREEKKDTNTMPKPEVAVFLDNDQKGVLKDEQNVLTLESVAPGNHKIVVMAKNRSGEIIDRKEINFISVEQPRTGAPTSTSEPVNPKPAPSVAQETRPAPSTYAAPPPASTSSTTTSSSTEYTSTATTSSKRLPKTASSDPLLAAAGLGLLIGGFALRRKA